jgi:RNAse (barnase) inhibitor barstar
MEIAESVFVSNNLFTTERLFRDFHNGSRYYFNEKISPCIGITSLIAKTIVQPFFLNVWRESIGAEKANQIMNDRANYGTVYHHFSAKLLIQKHNNSNIDFDFDKIIKEIKIKFPFVFEELNQKDKNNFLEELKSDLIAKLFFIIDYDLTPILIEAPLFYQKYQIACTVDFFGYATFEKKDFWGETYKSGENKGQPKKTTQKIKELCLIDDKTMQKKGIENDNEASNKTIGLAQKLQLNLQKYILQKSFIDFENSNPITLYNVIPKEWRTNPTMQISETDIFNIEDIENYLSTCMFLYPELFNFRLACFHIRNYSIRRIIPKTKLN